MPGSLTHTFVSTHTEAGSSVGQVSANEWNATHTVTGTWDSSQITSILSSQISTQLLSSQLASLNSSQIAGTVLSSQILNLNSSQIAGTLLSSQIASIGSSQLNTTLLTSQIAAGSPLITSSLIASVGSTQVTGTMLSSQGGTGATTLGAPGQLFYNNSSVITPMTGSSWTDASQTLRLTTGTILGSGMNFNTSVSLEVHRGLGGL